MPAAPHPETTPALTTRQAAEYLGLSPHTLERWRWSGHGPAYRKLGRAVRYTREDLDAYLTRCSAGPEGVSHG